MMGGVKDWDQILIRKIIDSSLRDSQSTDVDITGIIGCRYSNSMFCNSAFIMKLPDEALVQSEAVPSHCNFICSYKKVRNSLWVLNKSCILDLDADTLDLNQLKELNIGAFFINVSGFYSGLSEYGTQSYQKIKQGFDLSLYQQSDDIVDMLKLFKLNHSVVEWVYSIRKLRSDIPFGIRIPANYLERDIILAMFCEVDFIIIDCSDTLFVPKGGAPSLIPSLAAITRAVRILSKLNRMDVKIIIGAPNISLSDYFKVFALGASFVLINGTIQQIKAGDYCHFTKSLEEAEIIDPIYRSELNWICEVNDKACAQLKRDILECGYQKLSDISKTNLLTTSTMIKDLADIPTVADPDSVSLPLYHIKSDIKRNSVDLKYPFR